MTYSRTAYYRALTLDGDDEAVKVTWYDASTAIMAHAEVTHPLGDWRDNLDRLAAGRPVYANGYYWHQQDETTTDDGPF